MIIMAVNERNYSATIGRFGGATRREASGHFAPSLSRRLRVTCYTGL